MTEAIVANRVWLISVLAVYLLGMLALGAYFTRRTRTDEDFYVAGGKLSALVTGASYSATQISAGTFIGAVGAAATLGYNYVPVASSATAAPWSTFLFIGERVRRVAGRIGALTYGDILERRFGPACRLVYAVIIVLFYVPLLVAQFKGAGNIMQVLLGWEYVPSVFLSAAIAIFYTAAAGMLGDAYSDLIQVIVMVVGLIILLPTAVSAAGGFAGMHAKLATIDPKLVHLAGIMPAIWGFSNIIHWSVLNIGGAPHAIFRFLAAKDVKQLRRALLWALCFNGFLLFACGILGPVGRVMFPTLKDRDLTTPLLAATLLHPLLAGVMLSAIIAAIMSTVDSVMLLGASAVCRDIYQRFMNPQMTPAQRLKISRIVTIILGLLGVVGALRPITAVQWFVAFSFAVGAAAFTFPLLFAMWWPRATKEGALAGMVGGAAVCLFWYGLSWSWYRSFSKFPYGIWPSIIGTAVSLVLTVAVSLLTKPAPKEVLHEFYAP